MSEIRDHQSGDGRLSWGTRLSYASGDIACNVVFGITGTLLTLFYTDYVGISLVTVGTIMLVSRLFDVLCGVIMGAVVEQTQTKWGRFRPWILWTSVPYAVSAVLMFTVPQGSPLMQTIYVFVSYNLCATVLYTALNFPYSGLAATMTRVSAERDMLSVVRMGLAPLGRIMAVTCTPPLVKLLGDNQAAWAKVMVIWAACALVLLLICFKNCEETVVVAGQEHRDPVPMSQGLRVLVRNPYFWMVAILWMFQSVSFTVSGTVLPYYCKYILGNDTWLYSALYFTEIVIMMVCILLCAPLIRRYGKRNLALGGAVLALAGQVLFCLQPYSLPLLVVSCVTRGIGLAPLNAVVFGMVGDVVEYGQWRSHVRQESLIYAGGSVCMKAGTGIASAILTGFLSLAGYISTSATTVEQPQSALDMIVRLYQFGPIVVAGSVLVVLLCYHLDEHYDDIMTELAARESRGEL